jgi:MFS family permease
MIISTFAVPLAVAGAALGLDWRRARRASTTPVTQPESGERGTPATSVTAAASGVLLYAIVGPIIAGGVLVNVPEHWWTPTSPLLIGIGVATGLVLPGSLLVVLALAAPPLHVARYLKRQVHDVVHDDTVPSPRAGSG